LTAKRREITIVESFVTSKKGEDEGGEDVIFSYDNYLGVIDGVTSKSDHRLNSKTAGRYAAELISTAFSRLPADMQACQTVDELTRILAEAPEQHLFPESESMAAVLAVVNLHLHQLWLIGDCQALVDGRHIRYENRADRVMSEARALCLELERLSGTEQNRDPGSDFGRNYIMPLLQRQKLLHNRPDSIFGYAILNGQHIPDNGIHVTELAPDVQDVVLATDGYPVLRPTLRETEEELRCILNRDPDMCREYPSTKGLQKGNISYDDRAYLRIHWHTTN
jgi:glycerophosphoryl diester phosphodiesterase